MKRAFICVKKILFLVFTFTLSLSADMITIHNKSPKTIYVAPYYEKNKTAADRCGDIYTIAAGVSVSFERPARKFWYDRELFFSFSQKDLKEKLSYDAIERMQSQNVGLLKGKNFYIAEIDFELKGFDAAEWHVVRPLFLAGKRLTKELLFPIQEIIKRKLPILKNSFRYRSARVRHGNKLCSQEINYLRARKPIVKNSIETVLKQQISSNAVPTIAVVASGGGVRAMLATFGFLVGLKKIGLLDAITYICSLSGSTWAVAPWIVSGWPIEDIRVALIPELELGLGKINLQDIKLMTDVLLTKFAFNQPITVTDFFGLLLANSLLRGFGNERYRVYLSDQMKNLKEGQLPFPIYTAVRAEEGADPLWYEFTPYEIGGAWLGYYVPTWAFGRRFVKGLSQDNAPEQTLGFFMALFGSVFAATFNQMYQKIADQIPVDIARKIIEGILKEVGEKRLTAARVFNFTYGLLQSPIGTNKYMDMADAGTAFNLPYPPISGRRAGRRADIIIFLDASKKQVSKLNALKGAQEYARKYMLPFPPISYTDIDKKSVTVFKDVNRADVPVVIYMPLVKNEQLITKYLNTGEFADLKSDVEPFDLETCLQSTCDTFNFKYNQKQATQLSALTEFNMRANKMILYDVISFSVRTKEQMQTH
ncbi:hypothetical protein E3J79_03365 [Candidatus Dependentiae bacterium]|nr:MAG: hypothetical protein E3J79_03365 [Candidatus Dependentiae bacterium]